MVITEILDISRFTKRNRIYLSSRIYSSGTGPYYIYIEENHDKEKANYGWILDAR